MNKKAFFIGAASTVSAAIVSMIVTKKVMNKKKGKEYGALCDEFIEPVIVDASSDEKRSANLKKYKTFVDAIEKSQKERSENISNLVDLLADIFDEMNEPHYEGQVESIDLESEGFDFDFDFDDVEDFDFDDDEDETDNNDCDDLDDDADDSEYHQEENDDDEDGDYNEIAESDNEVTVVEDCYKEVDTTKSELDSEKMSPKQDDDNPPKTKTKSKKKNKEKKKEKLDSDKSDKSSKKSSKKKKRRRSYSTDKLEKRISGIADARSTMFINSVLTMDIRNTLPIEVRQEADVAFIKISEFAEWHCDIFEPYRKRAKEIITMTDKKEQEEAILTLYDEVKAAGNNPFCKLEDHFDEYPPTEDEIAYYDEKLRKAYDDDDDDDDDW